MHKDTKTLVNTHTYQSRAFFSTGDREWLYSGQLNKITSASDTFRADEEATHACFHVCGTAQQPLLMHRLILLLRYTVTAAATACCYPFSGYCSCPRFVPHTVCTCSSSNRSSSSHSTNALGLQPHLFCLTPALGTCPSSGVPTHPPTPTHLCAQLANGCRQGRVVLLALPQVVLRIREGMHK